jgi:TolB protein
MKAKLTFITALVFLYGCTENKTSEKQEEKPLLIESSLEIFSLDSNSRKVLYKAEQHFEAPNWSNDGKFLLYNSDGKIYSIPARGGKPELLNTGFAQRCNNDHGISPDNKELAVSHHEEKSGKSMIYILPVKGGEPRLITPNAPSYWHGWSPDGKTLAYCAERNGEYDIYTIPTSGGKETRLTSATGLDDGPDYTYDGNFIYFNSVRTGKMKIWKMKPDGSNQEQVTFDEYNDWFAHPSPDGKWLVFVSYEKEVEGHPANKNVTLRIMPMSGGEPKVIAKLFGGQGTINVPSWSPDSKQFAFVSYRIIAD